MQLGVPDAARLLDTSEEQIYAWISEGAIPFYDVNEQYRFHRAELLEWATANGRPVSVEIFHTYAGGAADRTTLSEALKTGGVHHGVVAHDKKSLIDAIVSRLPITDEAERRLIADVLLARDHVTTTVGDGIAIPHVRNPIVLHGARASISLSFLEKPLELGAADGRPIHTTFMLVTPTAKTHLLLLSQLSVALFDAGFKAAIARRASGDEILKE